MTTEVKVLLRWGKIGKDGKRWEKMGSKKMGKDGERGSSEYTELQILELEVRVPGTLLRV